MLFSLSKYVGLVDRQKSSFSMVRNFMLFVDIIQI